jgi:hypothetical protein
MQILGEIKEKASEMKTNKPEAGANYFSRSSFCPLNDKSEVKQNRRGDYKNQTNET